MIITKTPFRMSFFGGGTDMESFFKEYGGAVISTTFDKYCYVNVRHLPRFFDYSTELTYSKSERVSNIDDIQHPAIRNGCWCVGRKVTGCRWWWILGILCTARTTGFGALGNA